MAFSKYPNNSGVPPGGSTGQVLAKDSNADGDASWQNLSGVSVSSVNSKTGAVSLTTTDIPEGTNLYFPGFPLLAPQGVSPNVSFGFQETGNDTGWGSDGDGAQYWSCNNQERMRLTVTKLHVEPDLEVVGSISAANFPPTGSFNSFGGFDGTGQLYSIPGYNTDAVFGGMQFNKTNTFVNNQGGAYHSWVVDFNPTANAPDTGRTLFAVAANIDTANDGFTFGTNGNALTGFNNYINHQGKSSTGSISLISQNLNIGNGTDAITVDGLSYAYGFGNVNANVTMDGPIQGYGFQPNVDASATLTTNCYITAFYDNSNIHAPLVSGYTSLNAGVTIDNLGPNIQYTGVNINPTISAFTGSGGGVNCVAISGNIGTMGANSGWNGVNINPTITQARYAAGINVSMDNVAAYPGVQSTLVFQDLTFTWINPGDNNGYTMEYTPGATAGSEVVTILGNAITVQIDSGVSTALQVKAALEANSGFNSNITVTVSGVGSNPQVTAGPTNFVNGQNPGQVLAAFLDGDVQITGALSFNGALSVGKLSAFATQALVNGTGNPSSIHSLITQPTVAANTTITNGDLLGVNTASLINIGNNSTVTTAFLGVSALGLPAVLSVGSGSSIDKVSGAVFALSLGGPGGGTVDTVALCRALAIPDGVTTVNRLYGYEMALPFGDPGTLTWGLYLNNAPNNWISSSLKIGGTAGVSDAVTNSSVELELTSKAFRLANMDTAARNALTPLAGMVIFNTDTTAMEYYNGTSWV